jgi:hypothetical protein
MTPIFSFSCAYAAPDATSKQQDATVALTKFLIGMSSRQFRIDLRFTFKRLFQLSCRFSMAQLGDRVRH